MWACNSSLRSLRQGDLKHKARPGNLLRSYLTKDKKKRAGFENITKTKPGKCLLSYSGWHNQSGTCDWFICHWGATRACPPGLCT